VGEAAPPSYSDSVLPRIPSRVIKKIMHFGLTLGIFSALIRKNFIFYWSLNNLKNVNATATQ